MAESKPTQDGSLNTGSKVTVDNLCFTCIIAGQIQEAASICLDCCEQFCTSCLKYHMLFSATKHHKVIDKENLPDKKSILAAIAICTERCKIHKDEIIKYFCSTHKVLGCSVCVTQKHKLCNDVAYIPEAAVELSDSQEFKDFQNKLEKLIKKAEYITKLAKNNIKLSADYRANALQDIEIYRQELNDTLDKLKEELVHQTDEVEVKDSQNMGIVVDSSNQILAELQRMASDIKTLLEEKQHSKLYIVMKNAEDELEDMQTRLPKEEDIMVKAVGFQPNSELQKLIKRKDAFGNILVKHPTEINATFVTDINVISPENTEMCEPLSGALLSENRLVITDWRNLSVKLIDTEQTRILSECKMDAEPSDVTIIDRSRVAVTLPNANKIQFLKLDEDELRLDEVIFLGKRCWHVACVDYKLLVSFSDQCNLHTENIDGKTVVVYNEPNQIKELNMAGYELHTFPSSRPEYGKCTRASRLFVSSFNQAIYASDWDNSRVNMLDMDGNVTAVYENADLRTPDHITMDNTGMVYLCDQFSHTVHLLTSDCRKVKILLSKRDGIRWPSDICYCKVTRRLYVILNDDYIKVFQLS